MKRLSSKWDLDCADAALSGLEPPPKPRSIEVLAEALKDLEVCMQ